MADIVNQNGSGSVSALSNLVSIIVPCCGQLEYTKLCVPSLLRHSREPFELIFIDVGSLDGTVEYLAGVGAACKSRVEVVRAVNDGEVTDALKEAIRQARGDYLVLLNNDTIVTDNWLNHLISLANLSAAIGIVGPMANYAPPPQRVDTVPYRVGPKRAPGRAQWQSAPENLVDTSAVDAFARTWREKQRGKWQEVDHLGGFCLLLKREVIKKIGPGLETSADLGLFDTDALTAKARQAGFKLACCRDLYIHHFGTRTFAQGAPG